MKKSIPFAIIDGNREYSGLVMDLLAAFKNSVSEFKPQHIYETYKENPHDSLSGTIDDYMDKKTLAFISRPVLIGEGKTARIISVPIDEGDVVVGNFRDLCEKKGCTEIYNDSMM